MTLGTIVGVSSNSVNTSDIDSSGALDIDAGTGDVTIDSTSGSVAIGASLTDGQTLKLGKNGATEIEGKNQYSISYNHKISEFWSFTSSTTFDKKDEIKYNNINSKIKYEDECVGISFAWKRKYTHNPEDPTSNSFLFLLQWKIYSKKIL